MGPAIDTDEDVLADDVFKFRYRLGYESLCREVGDSITWRWFCRTGLAQGALAICLSMPSWMIRVTSTIGECLDHQPHRFGLELRTILPVLLPHASTSIPDQTLLGPLSGIWEARHAPIPGSPQVPLRELSGGFISWLATGLRIAVPGSDSTRPNTSYVLQHARAGL